MVLIQSLFIKKWAWQQRGLGKVANWQLARSEKTNTLTRGEDLGNRAGGEERKEKNLSFFFFLILTTGWTG